MCSSESLREVIEKYVALSVETHMHPKNTKFVVQAMLHEADCPAVYLYVCTCICTCIYV